MTIRVRLGAGPRIRRRDGSTRRYALALAAFMTPAMVMASVLAFWRILADLRFAGEFGISSGLFSHWQVWVMTACLLHVARNRLNRYGGGPGSGDRAAMP